MSIPGSQVPEWYGHASTSSDKSFDLSQQGDPNYLSPNPGRCLPGELAFFLIC